MIRRAVSFHRLLVPALLGFVPPAVAAEVPFSSAVTIESPFDFARSVASADLDLDGDLDLVGVASLDNAVAWWENTAGDGSAWSRSDLSLTFTNVRDIAVGDLDGDGDSDVVATSTLTVTSTSWPRAEAAARCRGSRTTEPRRRASGPVTS